MNDTATSGQRGVVPLMERVRAAIPELRNSEKKVATLVLEKPETVVSGTMASVAEAAGVSEPTVMRFALRLCYDGFQAFKFELTQVLALGVPMTFSGIQQGDSVGVMTKKVFDHSISSLALARRTHSEQAIERAVECMAAADSLTFIGFGASGIIAQDAEQKSGLFGVPCAAPQDAHQQIMAASMARPGAVFFVISNTGTSATVREVAQLARRNGATVIGLMGDQTPLAEDCDIVLISKTYEDTQLFTPMVSRLAGLVMIDVLATAVAAKRGSDHLDRLRAMKRHLADFRVGKSAHPHPPHP
ncbi:SIS domain-containing protein [uncultured Tessaracoccus sp.]|uniref:SIS domain-containing protein n=1 Tax=uncultured Tessaracoccus sp. TaxID=905023 RepID=UPI0026136427|nr:SIS domain-containing protein [uncultured Tessaracoccus sp.]